ncbi:Cytochrome P450 [Mycena venus]|uniref:Cytochrome P450 n=1 Tax=Mycena venus TaxID=2733690 RepID=A0A8H7D5S9_9AGAR|nr:Cytochrome P450 [Mycena venus]
MAPWSYVVALLAICAVRKVLEFKRNVRKVSNLPGLRSLFSPASPLGVLIPTSFWNPGLMWFWDWRNQVYPRYGSQTISALGLLNGHPAFYTISLNVARQVLSTKGQFEKAPETTDVLGFWGRNLFTENGSEWSRHRRIMNPAFNPETYALVWDEAANLYQEMTSAEGWLDQNEILLPATHDITAKFALIIIGRCGFGEPMPWDITGRSLGTAFSQALRTVSGASIARAIIPRWMYRLPIKRLHEIETAFNTLDAHIEDLIATRRVELEEREQNCERKDLFRLMIRANEGEGILAMKDEELIGNTYLILLAGHETTAKTLDATIGFLALHEDIQEELHKEIMSVVAGDRKINFKDLPVLILTEACFLEAARLFRIRQAPATSISRDTTETVVLKTDEDSHGGHIILEPGTRIIIDVVGLQCNPKLFTDPEEFRPSRWYGASADKLIAFSLGPRACIGRKFALTEAVAFLANLLRDWRLHAVLDPGETREQWRARVMQPSRSLDLTLGIREFPIRLTRR